eukprot:2161488-Pleurochrysis_carterae.AAC.2
MTTVLSLGEAHNVESRTSECVETRRRLRLPRLIPTALQGQLCVAELLETVHIERDELPVREAAHEQVYLIAAIDAIDAIIDRAQRGLKRKQPRTAPHIHLSHKLPRADRAIRLRLALGWLPPPPQVTIEPGRVHTVSAKTERRHAARVRLPLGTRPRADAACRPEFMCAPTSDSAVDAPSCEDLLRIYDQRTEGGAK